MSKLKIILTGATGMVGEGVLHECLQHPDVEEVLALSRKSFVLQHSKLRILVVDSMEKLGPFENELKGFNTCFFCLGVSSIGMNEESYTKLTYTLTMNVAEVLKKNNPDLCFCYISGASTDSSEKGRSMWARVKGKTENELIKMFSKAYMFRPGYMQPTSGLKNTLKYYKYFAWMYPALKKFFPSYVSTLKELGLAMIHAASLGYPKKVLEVPDIKALAYKKHFE